MNEELKNIISNLTLQELKSIETLVNILLDTKVNDKQPNIEVLQENKIVKCPKNINHKIKKMDIKMVYKDTGVMNAIIVFQ